MEVLAHRVGGDEGSIAELKNPGDFRWTGFKDGDKPGRMMFVCPCGCGAICGVSVKPVAPNGWEWDGSLDQPTITPSIQILPNHWHGYLTSGVFKSC